MIKLDNEEIWYWHKLIEEYKESKLGAAAFASSRDVDYKKFSNRLTAMEFKRLTNPGEYEKILPEAIKCLKSGLSASQYSKKYNVDKKELKRCITHLNYQELIEKIRQEKQEEKPMEFIEVKGNAIPMTSSMLSESLVTTQSELKHNDIELSIAQGVKVIISPNFESTKVLKIIDFLKDL